MIGSGVVATEVTAPTGTASAQFATGGSGAYSGLIDWITWGSQGDPVTVGATGGTTRTIGGVDLVTTCEIDSIGGDAGGVIVHEPGNFGGDALDDLYNVGGTGVANTMGIGLANATASQTVTIDVSCETTLGGNPVPMQGLVFAEAETSTNNGGEYVQATPVGPVTWRVIERLRSEGCTTSTEAVLAPDGTLRLEPDGPHCSATPAGAPGPVAIAFMEGATGATLEVHGGGRSAVALGVVLGTDFGDAPAGYGDAGAIVAPNWTGGELSVGTTNVFDGFELGSPTAPSVPRLGGAVDAESDSQPNADATGDGADEDGLAAVPALDVARGGSYTLEDVACVGPGMIAGWIDWNRNGQFEAGERSDAVSCDGTVVDLSWTVPEDAVSALGDERTFLRLRITPDEEQLTPTGLATAGEVEDYAITVDVGPAPLDWDFGDAPASYGSLLAADGARHAIPNYDVDADTAPVMLGASIDAEDDGQPTAGADGDDTTDAADDDGVAFNPDLGYSTPTLRTGVDPNTLAAVENTLEVTASADGFVSVWVDWNQDGDFLDAGEQVANATPVTSGANDVTFAQGTNPDAISGYVRVRYSTDAASVASPTGPAPDGEVEDYQVLFERLVQPDACTVGDVEYQALTFSDPVDEVDLGGAVGSLSRYQNVTVVDGVAVDMVVEVIEGQANGAGTQPENGFGGNAQKAIWYAVNDVRVSYSFYEAGTTVPVEINGVFTTSDMDGTAGIMEVATFDQADLASYGVTEGSAVTIVESGGEVSFHGNGDQNGGPESRFQIVLEAKSSFEARWQGGSNSAFEFYGAGDLGIDPPACSDFGDAPESYGTLLGDDGARHLIIPGLGLGDTIDFDPDGQPIAGADGDDLNRLADEDGVAFNPGLGYSTPTLRTGVDPNTLAAVENTLEVTASADGFVSVWVDWDQNGDFSDAGEQVANAQPVTAGANDVTFAQGVNPDAISSYVRVRYSTDAASIALPIGPAPDGEVEDYRVLFERLVQPDACVVNDSEYYAFTFADPVDLTGTGGVGSSARYENVTVIDGVAVDMVVEVTAGTLSATGFFRADGDDAGWNINAAGTIRFSFYAAGTTDPVDINGVFTVNDMDGAPDTTPEISTWDADDLAGYAVTEGSRVEIDESGGSVAFIGHGLNNGDPVSRFQVVLEARNTFEVSWQGSSNAGFTFDGDGDLSIQPPACSDFGDAPASYGTLLADDGARHLVTPGLQLGDTTDFDPDGQPVAGADGDDLNRLADEDGVATPIVMTTGQTTTVTVSATNTTDADAVLAGWIDLDGNGTFDAGELVTVDVPADSGTQDYSLVFPSGTATADTFARFRLFPAGDTVSPIGEATGGEVEDYPVTVLETELDIEKVSDATADSRPGDTITYTVTAENTGTGDFTAAFPAILSDDLSGVLDDASYDGNAVATIGGTDAGPVSRTGDVLAWSGALAAGETVTLTYTVTLTSDGDGVVRNVAWGGGGETPECDPPVGGIDPDTGLPCAESSLLLPRLTVDKSADTTDLPAAAGVVTYTVTVTNTGPGDYTEDAPAVVTDDLTEVLDDASDPADLAATIDGSPAAAPVFTSPEITWSGPLASGEVLVITYSVTYDDTTGDHSLRNVACVGESETAPDAPSCDFVQIPAAGLTQWKQAEVSDVPTDAGSTITYTLFFANDGQTGAAVDARDDLTHVLDDAAMSTAPSSPDGLTTDLVGNFLGVTGTVPPGETYTVTYTVTVLPDAERGDDIATNFLMERDPDGEFPPPPEGPDCVPTDAQFPDCTATELPAIEYEKSVEASTDPIEEGTVLTYTITVRNTGAAMGNLNKVDDLSGVLDDTELTSDPVSDTASVLVSSVVGGAFSITGTLPADGVAVITYAVTVLPQAERGDDTATNFVLDPGEDPPADCDPSVIPCTVTDLPHIVPAKSVDPTSGTSVAAGDELTYTLSFENTGDAAGNVDYTDLLAGIVDDGVVSALTIVSGPLDADHVGDEIRVTGLLPAGGTATITYLVTVGADGERGDNLLGNFLVLTGEEPPEECADDDPTCTENPIAEVVRWKTVDASTDPVVAGTVLTYNVFVQNIGEGPGAVDFVDDLTHVLDDGGVTAEPASSILSSPRTGETIAISGTVAAGVTAVVTYQVTIGADGERGDDVAANFLLETGDVPPVDPGCVPADSELPDCTVTGIGHLEVTKAVEASTDPVGVGTELRYTLTFENVGNAVVAVDKVDDLSDVLDDATLEDAPVASTAALIASPVVDDAFSVTGELAAGQIVTVEYSVIVNPIAERGNDSAANFVLNPGEDPPADCDPSVVPCTVTELPRIVVTKSVEASTDPVETGTVLSYTITFENLGPAAGAVDKVDDLSGVLDDAELTSDPAASDVALTASPVVDDAFSITGTLASGQLVTVGYEVTVRDETERGGSLATNFVLDPGEDPPTSCDSDLVPCTETEMPEIHDRKDVNPVSGTPVVAGQELTYTLTFRNDGTAEGSVDRVDDLTHLVDDADLSAGPDVSDAALTASGPDAENRITVTGALAPGAVVTVTYTVQVRASGERGDDIMANYLLDPGEEPPVDPVCEAEPGEEPDCTLNDVGEILPLKSSDPVSWSDISGGTRITYTLSFENVGQGAAVVDYTDYLGGVLDDAELVSGPTATGGLTASGPSGGEIRVGGTVAAGAVETVKYTVVVSAYAEQGDHRLGNFLVPIGFEPPTLCDANDPLCTWHEMDPPPGLAFTGSTIGYGALVALLLLLVGGGLIASGVRRRGA